MMRYSLLLVLLCASFDATAARVPTPGELDPRIRTAYYSPEQIYEITGFFGFQTLVQFAEDERIVRIAGYDAGWRIDNLGNKFVISPKEEESDSNLTVITEKRTYFFDLSVKPYESGKKYRSQAKDPQQTYALRFLYPDDDAAKLEQKLKAENAAEIAREAQLIEAAQPQPKPAPKRDSYTYMGSEAIKPYEVYDDGKFTYFKFFEQQDLPSFYVLNDDGTESVPMKHIEAGVVVVHRVAAQFVLRMGNSVVCIYNENPSLQSTAQTSPAETKDPVERVMKGVQP